MRIPVAGGIDGDNQEAETGDTTEHAEIRPTAQSQAVQKNQRYPPAADGNTDLVSVIEPNHVVGQSNSRSRSTGCRRTHRASLLFLGRGYPRQAASNSGADDAITRMPPKETWNWFRQPHQRVLRFERMQQ
ncbi:hypothetical protein [Mycobacterium dioxanotrophicus]|jgi:hypothetical protein|uniref:hypothetical protein n=1 Tax=Mycobacterium dioxanotrophicus TaxID=482462 RepID=UPI001E56BFEF|nr:hypothetical protein [Mycobacterium dioxanotrophicus]